MIGTDWNVLQRQRVGARENEKERERRSKAGRGGREERWEEREEVGA